MVKPRRKVKIERFVAKCIESKNTNDIISVFNSLEVNSVLEALGKDSNILHKHFLYFQISQNLEFLQLFINLIPFNKKKNQKQGWNSTLTAGEICKDWTHECSSFCNIVSIFVCDCTAPRCPSSTHS